MHTSGEEDVVLKLMPVISPLGFSAPFTRHGRHFRHFRVLKATCDLRQVRRKALMYIQPCNCHSAAIAKCSHLHLSVMCVCICDLCIEWKSVPAYSCVVSREIRDIPCCYILYICRRIYSSGSTSSLLLEY